jgi:hypothetical protein
LLGFVLASDPGSLVYGLPLWLQTVLIVVLAIGLVLILIYIYGVGSESLDATDEDSPLVQPEENDSAKANSSCGRVVHNYTLFGNVNLVGWFFGATSFSALTNGLMLDAMYASFCTYYRGWSI